MGGARDARGAAREVVGLYRDHGGNDYIGEAVTQQQHALQAAALAAHEGCGEEVVVGAFLHDVGHLVGMTRGGEAMVTRGITLGAAGHELVGSEYLEGLGFPGGVTRLVAGHVQAKRYLVATRPGYMQALTEASRMTLEHQGGPMTPQEVDQFRQDPHFHLILRMRAWDEGAKDPDATCPPLQHMEDMCVRVLEAAWRKQQDDSSK